MIYVHIYICVHIYIHIQTVCRSHMYACTRVIQVCITGCQRPIGCLIFTRHFPQKSPIIGGSFSKHDLPLKASYGSSLPCDIFQKIWYVRVCPSRRVREGQTSVPHVVCVRDRLQCIAPQCKTLRQTTRHYTIYIYIYIYILWRLAQERECNALQHTASHYDTLRHTATRWQVLKIHKLIEHP